VYGMCNVRYKVRNVAVIGSWWSIRYMGKLQEERPKVNGDERERV